MEELLICYHSDAVQPWDEEVLCVAEMHLQGVPGADVFEVG